MNIAVFIVAWGARYGPLPRQNDYGALIITLLIALPIVALVVGSMLLANRRRQARIDAMRMLANELGWKFDEQIDSLEDRMAEFHIGTGRRFNQVTHLMSGNFEGIAVNVYDFMYLDGGGKGRHPESQTVVELPRPGEKQPSFFLRPERAWWTRSLFEEYRDFDFENQAVFSKRYQLSGNNEAAVRALFSTSVIEFFEQHEQLWVESARGRFIYCRERITVAPEEIRGFVEEALLCFRLFEGFAK